MQSPHLCSGIPRMCGHKSAQIVTAGNTHTPSLSLACCSCKSLIASECFSQISLLVHVQDDIMYCNMTVEENLLFSARYRLPVTYTPSQHVYYVERAIQVI